MFREMRRNKQQLSHEEAEKILKKATSGVLALLGDEGYPYAVPLSYVYKDGKLYFHCAKEGHKIDAVRNCEKASFCVVEQNIILPEKYTTLYRSVVAFGKISVLEPGEEMRKAIEILGRKYAPLESEEHLKEEIESSWQRLCLLCLEIEHLSGKECIELVKNK